MVKGQWKMNVNIKSFNVNMDVKNKGIEFEVRSPDGQTRFGDCYLTKTELIWCPGKKNKQNGVGIKSPKGGEALACQFPRPKHLSGFQPERWHPLGNLPSQRNQ